MKGGTTTQSSYDRYYLEEVRKAMENYKFAAFLASTRNVYLPNTSAELCR